MKQIILALALTFATPALADEYKVPDTHVKTKDVCTVFMEKGINSPEHMQKMIERPDNTGWKVEKRKLVDMEVWRGKNKDTHKYIYQSWDFKDMRTCITIWVPLTKET